MSQGTYLKTVATLFLLIAVMHLLRLVFGWTAVFEGWNVPHWASVVALVLAGYFAYEGYRLGRR